MIYPPTHAKDPVAVDSGQECSEHEKLLRKLARNGVWSTLALGLEKPTLIANRVVPAAPPESTERNVVCSTLVVQITSALSWNDKGTPIEQSNSSAQYFALSELRSIPSIVYSVSQFPRHSCAVLDIKASQYMHLSIRFHPLIFFSPMLTELFSVIIRTRGAGLGVLDILSRTPKPTSRTPKPATRTHSTRRRMQIFVDVFGLSRKAHMSTLRWKLTTSQLMDNADYTKGSVWQSSKFVAGRLRISSVILTTSLTPFALLEDRTNIRASPSVRRMAGHRTRLLNLFLYAVLLSFHRRWFQCKGVVQDLIFLLPIFANRFNPVLLLSRDGDWTKALNQPRELAMHIWNDLRANLVAMIQQEKAECGRCKPMPNLADLSKRDVAPGIGKLAPFLERGYFADLASSVHVGMLTISIARPPRPRYDAEARSSLRAVPERPRPRSYPGSCMPFRCNECHDEDLVVAGRRSALRCGGVMIFTVSLRYSKYPS
ncbi:hypothetical protein BKA93DRAFT_752325 [Sparassis latifolia]